MICVATTLTNIYSTESREAKILTECIENFKEGWELKILEGKKSLASPFQHVFANPCGHDLLRLRKNHYLLCAKAW